MNLKGKRVFLISPAFFGYEYAIKSRLEDYGAEVDYFDDRPANDFWSKGLIRINKKLLAKKIDRYYNNIINVVAQYKYDYIIALAIETMPLSVLAKLRLMNPSACRILYLWDSLRNKKYSSSYLKCFDKILSFDKTDCKIYPHILFRPLFYLKEYAEIAKCKNYKYDFCFIGTAHSDRYSLIRAIQNQICNANRSSYWFMYLHSKKLYLWHKITNINFVKSSIKDFSYKSLTKREVLEIIRDSRVVLDIQHPNQDGLTMRTLEMLGAARKLVTTNKSVVEYDFYRPSNIYVIDRENPTISEDFMLQEYIALPDDIYYKYSIDGWLEDLLK